MIDIQQTTLFKTQAYINGEWRSAKNGEAIDVINPYTKKKIADVPHMSVEDCKDAIEAASEAFKEWSQYSAGKRARILRKWYELQLEHLDDLAQLLTTEQGKPLEEAKAEIKYGASFVEWFAEEAKRIYGDVIPAAKGKRITVIKQPVGVVGAITPWNFPNAMITRKVAPALAAGCTVVIKPAELTPLSALALAELAEQAGFPKGVLNIITTNDAEAIGKELTTNPTVKKISFTGSTKVGKILIKQTADTVKKVSMELGGNAPFIVFEDADIDEAVKGAIRAKFRNAGQVCICANRIFVQAGIYDEFVTKFKTAVEDLKIGNGLEDGVDVGPLVEPDAVDFVTEIVNDACSNGAKIITGGQVSDSHDQIYEPTVLSDAHSDMRIFSEEIFGPVAPIYKFETEGEVIKMSNDTEYGLASYFYGRDYERIWRVAEALEYGMVGINTGMISNPAAPFGGVKESGFGREGSKYGIEEYVNIKYMCWGGMG